MISLLVIVHRMKTAFMKTKEKINNSQITNVTNDMCQCRQSLIFVNSVHMHVLNHCIVLYFKTQIQNLIELSAGFSILFIYN